MFSRSAQFVTGLLIAWMLSSCGGSEVDEVSESLGQVGKYQQTIFGVAQKGPAVQYAYVTLSELDKGAGQTGRKLNTVTLDQEGSFAFDIPDSWMNASELEFAGYFLDELAGSVSATPVRMNAVISAPYDDLSVNILTTIAAPRIRILMRDQGLTASLAMTRAYQELKGVTGIPAQLIPELDMLDGANSRENALLLLYSGALLEVAAQYQKPIQQVIDQLAVDFANDGRFNQQGEVWLKRIQQLIQYGERSYLSKYANALQTQLDGTINAPVVSALPEYVALARRPSAVVTAPEFVCAGEEVTLSAAGSSDAGGDQGNVDFYWFQSNGDEIGFHIDPEGSDLLGDESDLSFTAPVLNRKVTLQILLIVHETGLVEEGNPDAVLVEIVVYPAGSPECDSDPVIPDPVIPDPVIPDPVIPDPVIPDPVIPDPVIPDPVIPDPVIPDPVIPDPVIPDPVVPDREPFEASAGAFGVSEGGSAKFAVTVSGLEGREVRYDVTRPPLYGTASFIADGVIKYVHGPEEEVEDSLEYSVTDINQPLDVVSATVTITIVPVNDDPEAVNKLMTIEEDQVVTFGLMSLEVGGESDVDTVPLPVTDADGDPLSVISVNNVMNGEVSIAANGSAITFSPTKDFNTETCIGSGLTEEECQAGFEYTVSDGNGGTAAASVSMNVSSVNDPPVAKGDSKGVFSGGRVVRIDVLRNDSDPEGDELTIHEITSGPSIGSASIVGGRIEYEVDAQREARVTRFYYTVRDSHGAVSNEAKVGIGIIANSPAPVTTDSSIDSGDSTGSGDSAGSGGLVIP